MASADRVPRKGEEAGIPKLVVGPPDAVNLADACPGPDPGLGVKHGVLEVQHDLVCPPA